MTLKQPVENKVQLRANYELKFPGSICDLFHILTWVVGETAGSLANLQQEKNIFIIKKPKRYRIF